MNSGRDFMRRLSDALARVPQPAARWSRLFGLGALVGVLGGLAAAGLAWGLDRGATHLVGTFAHLGGAEVGHFHWGVLLLPVLGGLASGIVVQWLCPHAVGHGTDALVRAFHRNMGQMEVRGPTVKAVAAVGVISCGGSAGPEGPIAALGAGIGSAVAGLFRLAPRERRILLVAGCGAGIGAIFQCPLGGALFATSVLYREPEFESEAIVPAFVSSVVGYSTFMVFRGLEHHMLEGGRALAFASPLELIPYAVLGLLCGGVSIFFSICLRSVERGLVPRMRLPRWFAPAVGGLATGALACLLPQVMDSQYDFVQNAMSFSFLEDTPGASAPVDWAKWAALFGAVALAKCVATAMTVGTGASGGVLGPSVFIGGVTGAFLGAAMQAVMPSAWVDGAYADQFENLRMSLIPVGMGGVLAAGMRTPLAAIVMVTEMTGSYGLIVPLMLVCVTAYVIGRRWGLVDEQVRSMPESPAHAGDAILHILESWKAQRLMDRSWGVTVGPGASLREMMNRVEPGTRPIFAVAEKGRLLGLISVPDIQRIVDEPGMADAVIAMDMMTERLSTVSPDDNLYEALSELRRGNHDVLPVVSNDRDRRWMGMLTRSRIFEALQHELSQMQRAVLAEHGGLGVIEQEGQLHQLVMGVSPTQKNKIQRLMVPLQAVGVSLRDADFRRNFGAHVIAIEQPDGSIQCPPDLDAPLSPNQRLVAVVEQTAEPTPEAHQPE